QRLARRRPACRRWRGRPPARARGAALMALRIALALCAVLVSGACLRLEDPPSSLANGLPCETDGQCEPGSVCEYDSSAFDVVCRTRDGCTGHEQCAATESCAFGACVPAECTQDAVCGAYACNEAVR